MADRGCVVTLFGPDVTGPTAAEIARSRRADVARDAIRRMKRRVVDLAREEAGRLALAGDVTAPAVIEGLRARGHALLLASVDLRIVGTVFRGDRDWIRVGWIPQGSHGRMVAVWRRRVI